VIKNAFSFALGGLIESGIRGITGALVNQGKTALEAYTSNERLGMSFEALLAREIKNASGIEKTITVGQQLVGLTKKEKDEIDKLQGSMGDLVFKRDQMATKIEIERAALAKLESSENRNELTIARKRQSLEKLEYNYQKLNNTISTNETRISELTTKQGQYVDVTETVREGQLSMNEALDQASPLAQDLLMWTQRLAIKSPFDQEGVSAAFRTGLAYGFVSNQAEGLATGTEGIIGAQEAGIVTAERLTMAMIDMTAGLGGTSETMGRVSLALGQIRAKGKVSAEELNQLREAGFGANEVLDSMGYTLDDVTRGLVDADAFILAAVETMENDFGGAAERMSGSWAGILNSIEDLKKVGLREFFAGTFQAIQPYMVQFVDFFSNEETLTSIREFGDKIGLWVGKRFGELSALIPLVTGAFDGNITASQLLKTQFGELGGVLADGIEIARRLSDAYNEGGLAGVVAELKTIIQEAWPGIKTTLGEWANKFWDWITGPGGVIDSSDANFNKFLDRFNQLITDNWPNIEAKLGEWNDKFWDWVIGPSGVIEKTTGVLNQLTDKINTWVESDEGQGKLTEMGENLGTAMVSGLKLVAENSELVGEVITTLGATLLRVIPTLTKSFVQAGESISEGVISAFLDEFMSEETARRLSQVLSDVLSQVTASAMGMFNPLAGATMSIGGTSFDFPGFASGGSFIVPGTGSGDRPFMMGLTPGELVSITPPGGSRSAPAGDKYISVNFYGGDGAPRNEREAQDRAYSFLNSLRSRGVDL
jgi:tape measure domain-containing protein